MSGKALNIPKEKLIEFVPGYGKSKCAKEIYAELKAAGWAVYVRHGRRHRNAISNNPDEGCIRALSFRLSRMRGVKCEMKGARVESDTRIKYFSREW